MDLGTVSSAAGDAFSSRRIDSASSRRRSALAAPVWAGEVDHCLDEVEA